MPRIYVSSRYRTANSQSTSDFVFPIRSGAIEFNQHSTAVVDSLCISNVFDTVIAGHNTKLYVRFTDTVTTPNARVDMVVELTPGDKTISSLAAELQTNLGNAMPTTGAFLNASVSVTMVEGGRLRLAIAGMKLGTSSSMEILTGWQLRLGSLGEAWTGTGANALDFNDVQDACSVCGFNSGLVLHRRAPFDSAARFLPGIQELKSALQFGGGQYRT